MIPRMRRSTWWALLWIALVPGPALAQDVPAPPPAYASASIGLDLVLEPLVSAGEADLANGALPMALARAQVVLAEVPAASSVHVRAEGLSLLARQRLGDTPAGSVGTDDAYAPLVDAASADVTASRFALARARLAWVLTHVPAESALALRTRAIQAALEARARTASSATSSSPIVVTSPTWQPPTDTEVPPSETPTDDADAHHAPRRRADIEIVDLYVTAGLMGAYLGAWIPESAGLLDHSPGDEASRALALAMIGGAGVMTLGVFALDQIDDGPRSGQPGAISEGIRFGFVLSGLTLGLLSARSSYTTGEAFDAMGIGLLGGAALGTIFAYAAEPHPAQVQFTQATGVWGGILGAELAALIAPLAFPNLGAGADRQEAGFGLTLGGLSAGILAGMALSAAHENFSARRSWLTTLGLVAGTGAGTLVWLLVSAGAHWSFDLPTWGGIAGVGGLGGLILAGFLTDGDHGPRNWDETPPVQVSVSPTLGGATLGFDGTF